MLLIAILQISSAIIIRNLRTLRSTVPGKVLEVFSLCLWFYYSQKIPSKETDFKGLSLDKFYTLESKYDLYIENFKLRLKTIDYYSKTYDVRLLRLIPTDRKNNLYYIVENASNFSGFNN
jgi:hypothetical protein